MKTLTAYHGKQSVKDKYVQRVQDHAAHDKIVKGQYWENGKGCAVGCTIHGADHKKYEKELGIPEAIAWLEDRFFEELPNEQAMTFPARFLEAIMPGADLSLVVAKLMVWQFEDKKYGIKHITEVKEDKELITICNELVKAYKKVITGEEVTIAEWESLEKRADKIYWAGAGAGAGAGAWAWARAWAGARAGARAWAGAGAGAWAGAGAGAGAWAEYDKYFEEAIIATADKFLALLSEAPVVEGGDAIKGEK